MENIHRYKLVQRIIIKLVVSLINTDVGGKQVLLV